MEPPKTRIISLRCQFLLKETHILEETRNFSLGSASHFGFFGSRPWERDFGACGLLRGRPLGKSVRERVSQDKEGK